MAVIDVKCSDRIDPTGKGTIGISRPLYSEEAVKHYGLLTKYTDTRVYEALAEQVVDTVLRHPEILRRGRGVVDGATYQVH